MVAISVSWFTPLRRSLEEEAPGQANTLNALQRSTVLYINCSRGGQYVRANKIVQCVKLAQMRSPPTALASMSPHHTT